MAARSGVLTGLSLFSGGLATQHCYAHNAALASSWDYLAGKSRALYEHAKGRPVPADALGQMCAELNSRGLRGEDHSGVGFGRELKHSYFSMGWPMPTIGSFASSPLGQIRPTLYTAGVGKLGFPISPAVPSGYPGTRYESATLTVAFWVKTRPTTGVAVIRAVTYPMGGLDGDWQEIDADLAAGLHVGTVTLDVVPGQFNTVFVEITATVSAGAFEGSIIALALSQAN